MVFDLADLASVRRGAAEILELAPGLDVLVNNAGLMQTLRSETVDGFETTFAVNHLGPFLLTNLLAGPAGGVGTGPDRERGLHRARRRPPRHAVRRPPVDPALPGHARLRPVEAGQHPLHPRALAAALGHGGDGQLAPSRDRAHRLRRATATPAGFLAFGIKIAAPFFLSPAKGARTSVYLASSPEVDGVSGEYFVKCKARQPRRWARDPEAAARLWRVSEELVGLPQHQES